MFNEYSKYYDIFNEDKPYKKEIDFIYKWADKPRTILDIGCGTALYWEHYPKKVQIYGAEKSKDMIARSPYKSLIYHYPDQELPTIEFDLATALFDVVNYIGDNSFWKHIPIKSGGYFIFDVWDSKKVHAQGFKETLKRNYGVIRRIKPVKFVDETVDLDIKIICGEKGFTERHRMYVYTHEDIERFCGKEFEIVEIKPTEKWQTWYRLRRK